MAVDSTFKFEERRNDPVKHDRDLMGKTIVAMQRAEEIQTQREQQFFCQSHQKTPKRKRSNKLETSIALPAVVNREEVMQCH
jgi:large subunit ribosomal protein L24e